MNESKSKRASFMMADLLSDLSHSPLPPEVNSSDSATGSDVIGNDVNNYCIQSPTSVASRGRIQNIEQTTNHRLNFAAETFLSSNPSLVKPVPCPVGLLQHQMSSSSCFQEAGVVPGGVDERQAADLESVAAAARLTLQRDAGRYITALQWPVSPAFIQHAIYSAGQNDNTQGAARQLLHH